MSINQSAVLAAIRKYNPTLADVHVSRPLTNMSVAFRQQAEDLVAGKWFPHVKVLKQADKYFLYPKDSWFRAQAQKRALGAQTAGGDFSLTTASYFAEIWGIHKDTPNPVRNNQDQPVDMDRDAAEFVAAQIMLAEEKEIARVAFTTGVWGQDWTGAAATSIPAFQFKYWDASGSTPIYDVKRLVRNVRRKTGRKPNTIVMGPGVRDALETNSDVVNRILYNPTGGLADVMPKTLAALFGVDNLYVAEASENTAKEGATAVLADIFGNSCWVGYVNPSPSINAPSAGYSFVWTGLEGSVEGFQTKRLLLDREDSTRVEGQFAFDHKIVAPECGEFISAILAP